MQLRTCHFVTFFKISFCVCLFVYLSSAHYISHLAKRSTLSGITLISLFVYMYITDVSFVLMNSINQTKPMQWRRTVYGQSMFDQCRCSKKHCVLDCTGIHCVGEKMGMGGCTNVTDRQIFFLICVCVYLLSMCTDGCLPHH